MQASISCNSRSKILSYSAFRNPQRPDYSAPFKVKKRKKNDFSSKKPNAWFLEKDNASIFRPLEVKWDGLKNSPKTFSPIQYTFSCVTQSSCLLQHQGYLGENTQQQVRPLSTHYHRNLFKKWPAMPAWSNFTSLQADSSSHFSKHTSIQTQGQEWRSWKGIPIWNNTATVPHTHLKLSLIPWLINPSGSQIARLFLPSEYRTTYLTWRFLTSNSQAISKWSTRGTKKK